MHVPQRSVPQCFCVDGRTGKKEVMGYVMLDLRMARTAKPAETVSGVGGCILSLC